MAAEKDWVTLFGVRVRPNHIEESRRSNDVDTTLRLSSFVPEKKIGAEQFSPMLSISNPTPLRCFRAGIGVFKFQEFWRLKDDSCINGQDHRNKSVEISETCPVSNSVSDHQESGQMIRNNKRKSVGSCSKDEANKRTKKGKLIVSPEEERVPSLDDIPALVEVIMSKTGTTRPFFLYKKKLEASDVSKNLNRLMINDRVKLMEFLTQEEISNVGDGSKGLNVSGIDSMGRVYQLCLKSWPSLKRVLVINSKGWYKLIAENGVEKGDWVQLWGYRESGKFCLAVEFRQAEAVGEAGSSGVGVASTREDVVGEAGSSGSGVASSKEGEAGSSCIDVASSKEAVGGEAGSSGADGASSVGEAGSSGVDAAVGEAV